MSGKRRAASGEKEDLSSLTARHSPLFAFVGAAMEAVLLLLICLSPWVYGAKHPGFEFLLDAGIALMLVLWAVRILLDGQVIWKKSGVALCLAGLFLLGVWQMTPLPRSVLSWLSPGTERYYEQFLPQTPEVLPEEAAQTGEQPRAGSTISLYPGATRHESLRILAVFLVFALVSNNLTSPGTLYRLSVAALLNGVLLSLFALTQFFGAPRNTVYWIYPVMGQPFGPFINRNDFAMYINLCIGLGIGLLVSQNLRGRSSSFSEEEGESSLVQTLQDPRAMWICAALGLMVSAVAFSRSRGGLLALIGAAVVCALLGRIQFGRSFRLGSLLLVAGVVVSLSAWFGIGLLKERLATFGSREAVEDRIPLWLRSLPIVLEFPIWGAGYGTYGYVEPMRRTDAPSHDTLVWYDHAHNDYLEILVEGGILGLVLVLTAVVVIGRRGYHGLIQNRDHSRAGLALGAIFGFITLAVHSVGEFGMHIPAIALFATVICAHLCALEHWKTRPSRSENESTSDEYRLRLGGMAPVVGAVTALGLGLVVYSSGWKAHRIDRLEDAAFRTSSTDVDQLRLRVAYLSAAASLDHEDAQIHNELGFAHARLGEQLAVGAPADRRTASQQFILALQEYLRARDACPLLSGAQLGIASQARWLKQGDAAEAYLHRVKLLSPGQAEMSYLCGLQEYKLNHREQAWETWRHCLELSDDYLPQILLQAKVLRSDQLIEKVLPDDPDLLIVTATLLYPDDRLTRLRQPFMEKALRILESKPEGMVPRELSVNERALKARVVFARFLYERGKVDRARRELLMVLAQSPNYGSARDLLSEIARQVPAVRDNRNPKSSPLRGKSEIRKPKSE